MLEAFINYICALMMEILGYYIIKKITDYNLKINIKNIFIILLNSLLIVNLHNIKFNTFTSLLNFMVNTITYKFLLQRKCSESFVFTGILMIIIFISELIWLSILVNFTTMSNIRNNIYLYLLTNIIITITSLLIIKWKYIIEVLSKFYQTLIKREKIINISLIALFVISISSLMYNITMNFHRNIFFLSNIIITYGTILIVIIYLYNKNEYNKLSNEYDILLMNVQNFENWIEKEQFMRHEYKNQLAIIYALSKEKEVKNKIQEIINQSLNIEAQIVHNLKDLPKGGLKGLIYYKTIVAQNNKIKVTVDVSIKNHGILNELDKEKIHILAKLIGIYYDNAIDAAKESRKKNILLEIYELKDKINIVLSNTFKKNSIITNQYEKGVSSKGENRGNGLYFARKILQKNSWIVEKQEIIDKYYIETISIFKRNLK